MKDVKFKSLSFNNRKKQITFVYTSGKRITLPFSHLGIKENIQEAMIDKATRGKSVIIKYASGKTDFLPYDQPLALVKDPAFLLQNHIEILIADIKEAIHSKKISKRYLAEQLQTSDNQIQRLLNPKILNKNLIQLYRIAALAGLKLEIRANAA